MKVYTKKNIAKGWHFVCKISDIMGITARNSYARYTSEDDERVSGSVKNFRHKIFNGIFR